MSAHDKEPASKETAKRKVNERASTSSNDASFEAAAPTPKKAANKKNSGQSNKQQTKGTERGQPKITTFQKPIGDDSGSVPGQLASLTKMISDMSEKMNTMMTKSQFDDKFQKLVTKEDLELVIQRVKREIKDELSEKMEKLERRIFDLEIKNDKLAEENEWLKSSIHENSAYLEDIDYGVQYALGKINDLEQYTRKSSVRIFGLDDEKDETIETTISKVNNLLNEKLGMDTKEDEINIAHRLGPFDKKKPRPVIVRFMSRKRKIETVKKRRALAKSQYVIKEDLTRENQSFLDELSRVDNVDNAWSNEGKLFAKIKPSGAIIRVFRDTDLSDLKPPKNWKAGGWN